MSKKKPASPKPAAVVALVDDHKPIDLAKLEGGQISTGLKFDPNELGSRAVAMLDHCVALQTEHAQKCILAGIYLHQVKVALGHGEFGDWKKKHFTKSHTKAAHYMALAEKFARSAKLFLPELVASRQLSLDLDAPKGAAHTFKRKLVHFAGALGITELLRRHGILKKGGKRTATPALGNGDATPPPASLSPEALAYQQMVAAVTAASTALLDDVRWSLLTPESTAKVDPLVKKLASDFHNRVLQARHEAAAAR